MVPSRHDTPRHHHLLRLSSTVSDVAELGDGICLMPGQVVTRVDVVPGNARRIYTGMDVNADVETVYDLLTDYEALLAVVPNLVVNEILSKTNSGATLRQVGQAQVLPGLNFRASMIMEVRELRDGLSEAEIAADLEPSRPPRRGVYPKPWAAAADVASYDVAMQSVAGAPGDFTLYQGLWRVQAVPDCGDKTRLTFTVEIQPRPWLPVALIESRIKADLVTNVEAVAAEAERRVSTELTLSTSPLEEAKREVVEAAAVASRSGLEAPPRVANGVVGAVNRLKRAKADTDRLSQGTWRVLFSSALADLGDKRSRLLAAAFFSHLEVQVTENKYVTVAYFDTPQARFLPPPALRLENLLIAPVKPFAVSAVPNGARLEPSRGPPVLPKISLPLVNRLFGRREVLNFDVIHADADLLVTLADSGDLRVCAR